MSSNQLNPQQSLKDIIKSEYKKCLESPIYFMKKYVKIQHPVRGTIPFLLYAFQESTLQDLYDNDFNIILKSRQMGISTLVAAYSLWLMLFHKDKNILVISTKQEVAKEIVSKVRFANDNLPSWLKVQCDEDNKLSLKFKNGSRILATSSAGDAGRSFALSLLVIDEAAFIEDIEDIWTSAYPTLSTGGRAIILSTPFGVGNFFHKMWKAAEAKENKFNCIKLPWHLHPERDQVWRDDQTRVAESPKKAAQELDCEFLTSGATVIDLLIIEWYKESRKRDPAECRGIDRSEWIWEYPDYSRTYIVCLPTGESVLTNGGIKKIENITYNDKLISRDGSLTDILDIKTRLYGGKIYEITPSNTFRSTKFTDEHPILVSQSSKLKRMYKTNNINYKFNQRYWDHDFKFIDAKNVKKGDWICYPNIYKKEILTDINLLWNEFENIGRIDYRINNNPLLNNDFWWFVGIWLAEGWCYTDINGNVSIHSSHNSNELDIINRLKSIVGNLFNRKLLITVKENNTTTCEFNSKQIGMFLTKYFGKYAGGKFISEKIKYISNEYKKSLIKGYIEGDGCIRKTKTDGKCIGIVSISLKLLEDIQGMLFSMGCISMVNLLRRARKSKIRDTIINQKQAYSLIIHDYGCSKILDNYTPKSKTQRIADCYFGENEDYIYFRVKKVNEMDYVGLVHNFTTSTGTFLCENITTHNCADVARGDGTDFSAYHVLDAETLNQCAEYKGQIDLVSFGHMLVNIATYYNKALLIVENTGLGFGTIQTIIDSGYPNTFYSTLDLKYVEVQRQLITKYYTEEKKMVPGFSTTLRTRPLIISRLEQYFRDKAVNIYSTRTLGELETFIWDKGKAVAMSGYNDDLCMALAIGLWVRDTALKLKSESMEYSRQMMNHISRAEYTGSIPIYSNKNNLMGYESWNMKTGKGYERENLIWLL